MRGQLRYLADSAQQGETTIQVVPYRAGAHAGTTGPFVILDFEEPTDPAMVYVETLAGDIYLEERSDVNRYTLHLTGCGPQPLTYTSTASESGREVPRRREPSTPPG